MAKVYVVNRFAERGGTTAIFQIKDVLVSASWVVSSSGDGSTYYPFSDGLTHSGSGAGGLDNNLAWFHIQDPVSRTGWMFQRSSGTVGTEQLGAKWRIKHLRSNITITGSATRTPFGPENEVLAGAGTDTSPTFVSLYGPSGTFNAHTIAMTTPDNTNVYPWWHLGVSRSTGICGTMMGIEPMLSSTYDPNNTDPYSVVCAHWPAGTSLAQLQGYQRWGLFPVGTNSGPFTGYLYNTSGSMRLFMVSKLYVVSAVGETLNTMFTTSSWSSSDITIPFSLIRQNNFPTDPVAVASILGMPKYIRWVSNGTRKWPDTYNLTTDAYVAVGHTLGACLTFPWPENVAPEI